MTTCPRCGNRFSVSADTRKQLYSCSACGFRQEFAVRKKGKTTTTVSHREKK